MYAVPKDNRCSKFFVKTRRAHIAQKFDAFDTSIKKDAEDLKQLCTIQKPLLNKKHLQVKNADQEISAQHEAMIRYHFENWRCIKQELEAPVLGDCLSSGSSTTSSSTNSNSCASNGIPSSREAGKIKYISSSIPKNFVPFDLESFWVQRILKNLTQST